VSQGNAELPHAVSPAAAGPAGARFEGKVGAFYLLTLLGRGEPRGLPGAVTRSVRFQQSAHGRPLDDVTIDAVNADGSNAFLDIQAKGTINFTRSDENFADVVRRVWATAQKPQFAAVRYEMAVAIARTSTRIERDCQQVLQWARQLESGKSFAAHMQLAGFASNGMREFVEALRHHLVTAGAPSDDETVWRLLRRFQILVFDFEAPGSDYEYRARERGRAVLASDQENRAADLWAILTDEALACDAAGGEVSRTSLANTLAQKHGLRFGERPDLRAVHARLSESAEDTLADIKDNVGGARLSRARLIDDARQAMDQARVVHLVGQSGVGKSGVLKALASQERNESTVLVLAPRRIIGGGWLHMAHVIGCPVGRDELFNELGCGGGATLFVDNIDQIDDVGAWQTLRDLLRGVLRSPGWRAVFTVRSDNEEWRTNLPEEIRQLPFGTVRVAPLSDAEADVLRTNNPALTALLSGGHPARAMARNLFYLSCLVDWASPADQALANELDLARLWWRFGGARSEAGRLERLKLLRNLGERLIRAPGLAVFRIDEMNTEAVEELLQADSLREDRAGDTVTFRHDTLRDWTIGFVLDERPELRTALPVDSPLPGTLARALEIAARLALDSDATGARWLALLAEFERDGCHGSWRRPVLMGLPRSENASHLLDRVAPALLADKGRRLKEIIQLMIAVETVPLAQILARAQTQMAISETMAARMVMPSGPTWMPLVFWTALRSDRMPSALIPELAKVFQLWLVATHTQTQTQVVEINQLIVQLLYQWLTRIEEADRITDVREAPDLDLDFEHANDVREEIRMTFLFFCHLNPQWAGRYLAETNKAWHRGACDILKFSGMAARAAPTALADFALAALIPKEDDEEDRLYRRRRSPFGAFDIFDSDFRPVSPGQGPFFTLLQESPQDGLRLVRGIVEHATQWQRDDYASEHQTLPVMSIPFPDRAKSFEGDSRMYQWARGGALPLVVASALMALEAWAHRQIEGGRTPGEVLHDVLGPSGSSVAFVCVAVDLVLSHWAVMKEAAWPMLAAPELLQYDHMRFTQDQSGIGRLSDSEPEGEHWPVKKADLLGRPSRRQEFIDKVGDYALYGPDHLQAHLRDALVIARDRVAQSDEGDPILGLRATAERALRMNHAEHWQPAVLRLDDGRKVEVFQYQLPPEEVELRQAAVQKSSGNIAELNIRFGLQKALSEPVSSTPQLVEQGIAWAREKTNQPPDDSFDTQWEGRAVVMAAALAARDYEGTDCNDVEAWSRSILHMAATEPNDDIYARSGAQIWSSMTAIAAVGYRALYCRSRDADARDALLRLAARQDHPVTHAIGGGFAEFSRADVRLPIALSRLAMRSAVHPRRTLDPAQDTARVEAHRQGIAEAIDAEKRWLNGDGPEPPWAAIAPWHSRRRRGIRLGPRIFEEDESVRLAAPPEMYVDEQALAILANYLIGLMIGGLPVWVVALLEYLMPWTIEANNGPPGDDEHERENRPLHWNMSYFDILGILCVALPFERARALFIEPIMTLHEEAFLDATGAFLRGFDRATLATDMPQPENPVAVRSLFVERLRRGRRLRNLEYRDSFSAESHLGDALHALFYQPSRFIAARRPHIPNRWSGLLETIPILTPLVTSIPRSGYLAVVFITLMESYACAAFLPAMVEAASAWRGVHDAGANFWSEHQVGHRICEWIEKTLADDPEAPAMLVSVGDELGKCLDVLVRSGIASARILEARIADECLRRKGA
jgi:hypothetical protein